MSYILTPPEKNNFFEIISSPLDNLFKQENINNINNLALTLPESPSTFEGSKQDKNVRHCVIKWIGQTPESLGLFNILKEYIIESNSNCWNFDITYSDDSIQYTEYKGGENGHYDWHMDMMPNNFSRKLSLVVQLSDPNEYEGGELHFQDYKNPQNLIKIEKKQGLITIFPSYLRHKVTPVTKGIRKSLVWWVGGSPFR